MPAVLALLDTRQENMKGTKRGEGEGMGWEKGKRRVGRRKEGGREWDERRKKVKTK